MFLDAIEIKIKTTKLPKHDASVTPIGEINIDDNTLGNNSPARITKATPRLAPELNPKTSGPAKGFRNNVCINNPATDKPTPTKMAVIAFGIRNCKIMYSHVSFEGCKPKMLFKTSLIGIKTCPNEIFNSNEISKVAIKRGNK